MENAIIARNFKFESKELQKATSAIIKAEESAAKSLIKIAAVMAEVDARELWKDDFKSTVEYGQQVFGYKKTAVYNMVRVGRDYLDPATGRSVLALDDGTDFTFNQLTRLLPLPSVEDAVTLAVEGHITPDMTLKEIDKAVKDYKESIELPAEENGPDPDAQEAAEIAEAEAQEVETVDEIAIECVNVLTALDRLSELMNGDGDALQQLNEFKDKFREFEKWYGAISA